MIHWKSQNHPHHLLECGHRILKFTSCYLGTTISLGDPERIIWVNCQVLERYLYHSVCASWESTGLLSSPDEESLRLDHLSQPPRNCSEQFVLQSRSLRGAISWTVSYETGGIFVVGSHLLPGDFKNYCRKMCCSFISKWTKFEFQWTYTAVAQWWK